MIGKISDEDIIRILWAISIPTTTLVAILVTIFSVTKEMTDVFPHLYYLPIILNAYQNPKKALLFAGLLGAVYAGLVYLLAGFAVDPLVKALIRVLVFIWVAAIISYLSGNLQRRNQILAAMNEIIAAASTSATLDEILSTAGRRIREILASDMVMVFLVDRDGKQALMRYQEGLPDTTQKELGLIDLTGEPFRHILAGGVPEITCEGCLFGDIPFPGIQSFVVIPLPAGAQLLGVITAGCTKASPLARDEMRMLESVSRAILGELVTDKGRDMLRKLESAVSQSVEIIHNVSTIRRIQESSQGNRQMDLDPIIRSELGHQPDISLHYEGTTARVCANNLISEVFRNLIGNSAKFGGPGIQVWIRVTDEGDRVTVSVEDNGPGIPDELKPVIFNRFQRGKTSRSGKGLGLYISRMIIEGYGGRIWVGDRVEKEPKKGAAIRFTLRKSCTA
jgi:signal transduction histidine kinase